MREKAIDDDEFMSAVCVCVCVCVCLSLIFLFAMINR
jgi:hypothetical protein